MNIRLTLILITFLLCPRDTAANTPLQNLKPFLQKHCYSCHGPKKQKNDLRFDTLKTDLSKIENLEIWQEILDQLNLGEMPPEEEPTPDPKQTKQVIQTLTTELKLAYQQLKSTNRNTVIRRLNRFELRNTVRDLLHIKHPALRIGNTARLVDNNGNGRVENTSSDPFRSFPADEQIEGFDNIGNQLVMSDFFLNLMFNAAEECLDLATVNTPKPNIKTQTYQSHIEKRPRSELQQAARALFPNKDTYYFSSLITPDQLRSGIRTSAHYRITFHASAQNQKHP